MVSPWDTGHLRHRIGGDRSTDTALADRNDRRQQRGTGGHHIVHDQDRSLGNLAKPEPVDGAAVITPGPALLVDRRLKKRQDRHPEMVS